MQHKYTPIPTDTVEQRLALFDAERAELDADRAKVGEMRDLAHKIMERADAGVRAATKVETRTPSTRVKMYGVDGRELPQGPAKPYDIPAHDLTAQAWDEALETFKYHLDEDLYAQIEDEIVQRLKNLLEAVRSAYDNETVDSVENELKLEGYGE